ncbi:MAG: hypothetical protein KAJ05_05490, partial [Candidatus Latescibacteria bacterium]|nr:hypothetical protein [Candidatus Latescibacterota bacterium]
GRILRGKIGSGTFLREHHWDKPLQELGRTDIPVCSALWSSRSDKNGWTYRPLRNDGTFMTFARGSFLIFEARDLRKTLDLVRGVAYI